MKIADKIKKEFNDALAKYRGANSDDKVKHEIKWEVQQILNKYADILIPMPDVYCYTSPFDPTTLHVDLLHPVTNTLYIFDQEVSDDYEK